ncbi:MAG: DUF504 domain-containing protein [Candidatus Woesearchaeota archaeon]
MKHIKDVLNKIIWDAREHPEEYTIGYHDRFQDKIIEIPFKEINRIEEGFVIIERAGEETMIPLHRIRIVRKKDEVVWRRLTTNN